MRNILDSTKDTSSHSCYSNQSVQNQTRLDRNENCHNSHLSNCEQNNLSKISQYKQSFDIELNNFKTEERMKDEPEKEKPKKTVKRIERKTSEGKRDHLLEKVTETRFQRTRMIQIETSGKRVVWL